MKKLVFTLMVLAAFGSFALGQQSITGSPHDFSGATWNTAKTGQICAVCHAPHNNQNTSGDLLWNHRASTAGSYTPYDSPTMEATMDGSAVAGSSKLCLSCHDGTVGLSDFGGVTTGANPISGVALMGTDLSNDHPISIDYTTALAGGGLRATGYTLPVPEEGVTTVLDLLYGGTSVECSSCHDVHRNVSTGNTKLLRVRISNSTLCLTCHAK